MGSKHDPLSEEEMRQFSFDARIGAELDAWLSHAVHDDAPGTNLLLDWGCGRGRSVAWLLDKGLDAYGVDADQATLNNGYSLLQGRGYVAEERLLNVSNAGHLPSGSFGLIFSEETLEHIGPIAEVTSEMFRLTRPGGIGVHSYPGSRRLLEPHVRIPLVHWFDNGLLQQVLIGVGLMLGLGPRPVWPEARDKSVWEAAGVYVGYLRAKTHYRDVREIARVFRDAGFEYEYRCDDASNWWMGLIPRRLRENGFPNGQIVFRLRKPV